jgi:4-diphosphocytidyl-2-C-methyl-D-erythritol kinase
MTYLAPAKINLNLLVESRDERGYHPLRSVVQTLEWCDQLVFRTSESDKLVVEGAELPDGADNIVVKAIDEFRKITRLPPLSVTLEKEIAVAAGLGGGSADAAATLVACCDLTGQPQSIAIELAPAVGADVSVIITGGTLEMTGYGERVERLEALTDFAVAVVVPDFELSTPHVYQRWDELNQPEGFVVPDRFLPPSLRNRFPIRNDLYRAAVDIEPALGDFVRDVSALWDGAVLLTGSGPACFGFFPNSSEADEAARSVPGTRSAVGVALRPRGVERIHSENDDEER